MANRYSPLWKKLSAMQIPEILLIWSDVFPGQSAPSAKSAACDALSDQLVTLDRLEQAMQRTGLAPAAPAISQQEIDAIKAVADRADAAATALNTNLNTLQSAMIADMSALDRRVIDCTEQIKKTADTLLREANQTDAAIRSIDQRLTQIAARESIDLDSAAVQAAVNKVIADAFAPFKRAVEQAGAEEIVAALAPDNIEVANAENIFGLVATDNFNNPLRFKIINNPAAPAVDDYFIWQQDILQTLYIADQDMGKTTCCNIWAGGEKGTGKTETAKQFAARTKRPYFRINFQKFTSLDDICGAVGLNNGNTEFVPGVLLQAWSTPYAVINLDEPSFGDPGVMGFLNGLLEPNSTISYGGKIWKRAPGVIVLASDNTHGSGDASGLYAGTRVQSAALIDRFGLMPLFEYLPRDQEIDAVVRHTGCKSGLAEHVIDAIRAARAKVSTGEIISAPSIRSVCAFVNTLRVMPLRRAWDQTIAARQPAESAVALQAIFESCISEQTILKNI